MTPTQNTRQESFRLAARTLLLMALSFWLIHGLLRGLLLFRLDPYGIPFVNKPDWYIFHALALDYQWLLDWTFAWLLGAFALAPQSRLRKALLPSYFAVQGALLLLTLLDQEVQRFLGMHLTWGLADTYKDTSSLRMFVDYVRMDQSVPYLQFVLLALLLPAVYAVFRWLTRLFPSLKPLRLRNLGFAIVAFYVVTWLFLNVIWTGTARLRKLAPVVTVARHELSMLGQSTTGDTTGLGARVAAYQKLWQQVDGDSLWAFPDPNFPLLRVPAQGSIDARAVSQKALAPNIIVVFLESQRGMDVGFLNRFAKHPSPTPFMDSLASRGRSWSRMHASGLPTVGGVLSSHMGVPPHTRRTQVTELVQIRAPSFASTLRDSGYTTHYFSAADPAWDNLSPWMRKWYDRVHYDRLYEDDSSFWRQSARYVIDSLGNSGQPFLATLMTRSNHYPFNFAPGMPESEKSKPVQERIRYTMRYADRQMAAFVRALAAQPWFERTYLVILADHGFPLGENGASTMSGGAYSNATWIPLLIIGPGLEGGRIETASASQLDLPATILGLAGVRAPTVSMGHDLLRGTGTGMALGSHYGFGTLGFDGFRLMASLRSSEFIHLYAEPDTWQNEDVGALHGDKVKKMRGLLDTLLFLSDYALESDRLVPERRAIGR